MTMLFNILALTTSTFPFYPYIILFLVTFVEGPIATLSGGSLAAAGVMHVIPVYFTIVLANLTADLGWYSLGRFGKVNWLERIAPKIGISSRKIQELTRGIQKQAPKLLFLTKFSTGFPIPTLIATGLGRVPVHRWFWASMCGELIKSAILVGVGYYFSKTLRQTTGTVQTTIWILTGLILVAGIVWSVLRKKKNAIE